MARFHLLSGIILLDTLTGKTVIVNSVEVFGRRRSLDAHRESFRVKKKAAVSTLLPPETTRYRNVWPTSYSDVDGIKLVIGTKIFNALVTSSLRIDIDIKPEIGPVTSNLILNAYERSFATKIFVKKSTWESAQHIAKCERTNKISGYDVSFQLRQLHTRFHQQSTYFACRGFNEPTDDISTRPHTAFTLCEWDNGNNGSGYRVGSLLL
ncbi:hypothetical protein G6F43_009183 [Rhizopus delemar]|nr:hypothetical protein G6F43_009183 [Rhizopus delemar]